jgi:hypothetical protein
MALEKLQHVVIGDWMTGFALVQGGAGSFGGRGWILRELRFLRSFSWVTRIRGIVLVHNLTVCTYSSSSCQRRDVRVIYGLIGTGILQSLILVQRQVLIICIVVMRRM